jgi:hypothetical protein
MNLIVAIYVYAPPVIMMILSKFTVRLERVFFHMGDGFRYATKIVLIAISFMVFSLGPAWRTQYLNGKFMLFGLDDIAFHDHVVSRHVPCWVHTLFTINYAYNSLRLRILSSQTHSFIRDRDHPTRENLPCLCNIIISAVVYFWSNFNKNYSSSILLLLLLHWLALSPTIFPIEPSWSAFTRVLLILIPEWSSPIIQRTRDDLVGLVSPLSVCAPSVSSEIGQISS